MQKKAKRQKDAFLRMGMEKTTDLAMASSKIDEGEA